MVRFMLAARVHGSDAARGTRALAGLALLALLGPWAAVHGRSLPLDELAELSIEQLMQVSVTSVSKRTAPLADSAAAVFVITNADLRRSGATSIPEALRMVPGLEVARIDGNKWAITARGFNGRFANKLLVLIDGRSVYTPSFSGVYWEVQDLMLEDVERIEVIRGPGATLWGANAVNGVINIITKPAADTQGGLLAGHVGSVEQGAASVRYGMKFGEDSYGRLYAKGFRRGASVHATGFDAGDDWGIARGGFRLDTHLSTADKLTLQGDVYRGSIHQSLDLPLVTPPYLERVHDQVDVSGANLLGRWGRTLSSEADLSVQAYYDRTERDEAFIGETRETVDLDLQHRFTAGGRHEFIWGLGARWTRDRFRNTRWAAFVPDERSDALYSAFLQDDISFSDGRVRLTLGSKFEHNDYTGFEIQPNARLLWSPNPRHTLWAAVSRAVRSPSRGEDSVRLTNFVVPPFTPLLNPGPLPAAFMVVGNEDFDSEDLLAYELGYRFQPTTSLSVDLAAFANRYHGLRSFELGRPFLAGSLPNFYVVQPLLFGNKIDGEAFGAELALDWQAASWWRWRLAYAYRNLQLHRDADSTDFPSEFLEGTSPRQTLSLRSSMDLAHDVDLDLWLRAVDELPTPLAATGAGLPVDGYLTLDARLAWRPGKGVELALVGQNLLDDRHLEFIQENFVPPTEVRRGVMGTVTWRF